MLSEIHLRDEIFLGGVVALLQIEVSLLPTEHVVYIQHVNNSNLPPDELFKLWNPTQLRIPHCGGGVRLEALVVRRSGVNVVKQPI